MAVAAVAQGLLLAAPTDLVDDLVAEADQVEVVGDELSVGQGSAQRGGVALVGVEGGDLDLAAPVGPAHGEPGRHRR
ncbi:MAG: hypothetical protein M3O70_00400 [Actinomycetota bacterium]|nr:hypothetical protein [Actinomycetota bacterium]